MRIFVSEKQKKDFKTITSNECKLAWLSKEGDDELPSFATLLKHGLH